MANFHATAVGCNESANLYEYVRLGDFSLRIDPLQVSKDMPHRAMELVLEVSYE